MISATKSNLVRERPIASDAPLRVLLISSSSGSAGGGELYLVGLAGGLRTLGHEVHVAMAGHERMDGLAAMLAPCATVHRYSYRNTYDRPLRGMVSLFGGADQLARRLIDRLVPDVVHINKQNIEDGLDLMKAAVESGFPLVTTIHVTRSMANLGARGGWLRDTAAIRYLRRTPSHLLAIADACRNDLNQLLFAGDCSSKVHCVNNGVNAAPTGDRAGVRQEWACREGDLVLGCVARIEPQKNPLFAVDLLVALPSNVRVAWIGDGRLRGDLDAYAKQKGVRDRLHLDGWRQDARRRMAGFDLFLLPSLYEGFAFAVLEAMAAGLACVASDVDGTREAVVDGVSGYLCPVNDLQKWSERTTQLIADENLRARFGQAGKQLWEERFSLQAMAQGTADVYRRVIAQFQADRTAGRL